MKCKLCNKKAVIRASPGKFPFCEEHFIKYFEKKLENFKRKIKNPIIALSGGIDSCVLAYFYKFDCVYINLNIPNYSDEVEKFCKEFCKKLGINLYIINL